MGRGGGPLPEWLRNGLSSPAVRLGGKLVLDGALAALAWAAACVFLLHRGPSLRGMGAFVSLALGVNMAFRLCFQHYRLMGFPEARTFLLGNLAILGISMLFCLGRGHERLGLERPGVLIGASLITGPLWFALRMAVMSLYQRRSRRGAGKAPRVLIVGAGRAGMRLCQELQEHPGLQAEVLGFVDDALEKQGVRILGVPVLGPTRLLPVYVREQGATMVILCMASVPGVRIRELTAAVQELGIAVKTVPGILDLVGDRPWKPEIRDVAIEDLLRREPVTLDTEALRRALRGSVTLITGAGGSIGSELARRVAAFQPDTLVLLGRGENSLWEIERELRLRWPGQHLEVVLCDIRDPVRLHHVFDRWRPGIVLHAAAHKHVPFLEMHPEEAILNNVFGTLNVLKAALAGGTGTFVNVSTDKAVNPTNVLGVSKRIAEHLVRQAAGEAPPGSRFVSVRFGNVMGSRGSVIRVFREQIRAGGPLTVTHPDMTRYFMTIPEASALVLQAGILGGTGKVFALDMGEPVRILDLARDMARLSGLTVGVDIEIQFRGARPGEKLVEELFSEEELRREGVHPKVLEAVQDPRDGALLEEGLRGLRRLSTLPEGPRRREMILWFQKLVPTYQPSPEGLGRYGAVPPSAAGAGPDLSMAPSLPGVV